MQTFLIYCIHTYNDLRTLLNHTLLKSTKNSPQFQNKASFTARISNRRSERLIWTVARVSFQMRPSMHRKARISNPTFKPSLHICSKSGGIALRSSIIPLLAPQKPQERFRRALWLRVYGSVDKTVHALAVGFCVGSTIKAFRPDSFPRVIV